ncbi:hypothetical protein BDM02DRAFT_3189991 [Thelephora ganbajun]|uniref:Uncharacterized protein n=1 Tax=Thelephora ganbajun TaxID=370292 RepID=A0ACB6Z6A2_THEGA|nr:hypothetical protein BDM02DRAFT_3189991 [Thelephora ganbajun]
MGIQPWTRSGCTTVRISLVFLLVFMVCLTGVDTVNLDVCGAMLEAAHEGAWNATNSTSPPPPLHLSYEQCVNECGGGIGDINWESFSQSFGAWFLPWIALMFQIPFGAEYPLEDVLSFFMTIGSPALAAYSLQITHLNAGWLSKAFLNVKYPNSKAISTVMSTLQHVPIRISSDLNLVSSLIVLPRNGGYWGLLLKGAEKTRRWSIPLVMNFAWAIIATLLTTIDSFYNPPAAMWDTRSLLLGLTSFLSSWDGCMLVHNLSQTT